MPELPEVETTRTGIAPHIIQQRISKINLYTKKLRWPIPKEILKLEQQIIIAINRRGKYILLDTLIGTAIIHLGMSGYLQLLPENTPLKKHDHIEFIFKNGLALRLNDTRRFGALLWQAAGAIHPLLENLGPEPLTNTFSVNYLHGKLQTIKRAIKLTIMDNAIVVGVGNIYANEALFIAGINPNRNANLLSVKECDSLVKAIKTVLKKAIKSGGTTIKDFQNIQGKPGYFQQSLKVYGRIDENCDHCSKPLSSNRIGQRLTVWCDSCQI